VDFFVGHFNYWVIITLMMTGLYVVISTGNLVKKLVGIGLFQTSVFQLYISLSKVRGAQPPIIEKPAKYSDAVKGAGEKSAEAATDLLAKIPEVTALDPASLYDPLMGVAYSNPLPHVLILTAIVVGVATLAVGLALVVRIREAYGTIEEDAIDDAEYKAEVNAS